MRYVLWTALCLVFLICDFTMPQCQAFGCTNKFGKNKKSLFRIPDPEKSKDSRKLCKKWIDNIKNGKVRFETLKASKSLVVCEDHFTKDCFSGSFASSVAESLDFQHKRKTLKPDAVPTIITTLQKRESVRKSTIKLLEKKQVAQLKERLTNDRGKTSSKENEIHLCTDDTSLEDTILYCEDDPVTPNIIDSSSIIENEQEHTPMVVDIEMGRTATHLQCGHACILCNENETSSNIQSDHAYVKERKTMVTVSTQTCEADIDTCAIQLIDSKLCSTPKRTALYFPERSCVSLGESDLIDFADLSASFRDDSGDITFQSTNSDSETDCEADLVENKQNTIVEHKYIVFEACLRELFVRLKCSVVKCTSPVDPDDIEFDRSEGSLLKTTLFCTSGHTIMKWSSQPMLGKMPAGNLLLSAAVLFSGQTYTRIAHFFKLTNLNFLSHTTFDRIQRQQLMPVVLDTWSRIQDSILEKVKATNRPLRLVGDGRCDSPGFSAKYLTYSLMDLEDGTIVTFVVIKVTQTGSSGKMEVFGFRQCMEYLIERGFRISVLATDRHVQVRSVMSREFMETNHQFDVWHLAKSVKKKLAAKAKCKGAEELADWIKAVTNHLWWCASMYNGDKAWLDECWVSLVSHVVNEHTFTGDHVTECPHEPLDPDAVRKKKWLKKNSKAHNMLKEVILDKRLRKDIKQLSEFCHTGSLEVYHSMMTKYVPKRQEFDYDQMLTRTTLAVIDHNSSLNRNQKINREGEHMFKVVCPKATGHWVAKPVYEDKNYDWINSLMVDVVKQKEDKFLPPTTVKKKENIAPTPAPSKYELIRKMKSRFTTNAS